MRGQAYIIGMVIFSTVLLCYGLWYANNFTPSVILDEGNVILVKGTVLGDIFWEEPTTLNIQLDPLSISGDVYNKSLEIYVEIPGLDNLQAKILARITSMLLVPADATIWLAKWLGEGYEVANTYDLDIGDIIEQLNDKIKGVSYARFLVSLLVVGLTLGVLFGAVVSKFWKSDIKELKSLRGQRVVLKSNIGEKVNIWDYLGLGLEVMVGLASLVAFIRQPSITTGVITTFLLWLVLISMGIWNPFKLSKIMPKESHKETRSRTWYESAKSPKLWVGTIAVDVFLIASLYIFNVFTGSSIHSILELVLIFSLIYTVALLGVFLSEHQKFKNKQKKYKGTKYDAGLKVFTGEGYYDRMGGYINERIREGTHRKETPRNEKKETKETKDERYTEFDELTRKLYGSPIDPNELKKKRDEEDEAERQKYYGTKSPRPRSVKIKTKKKRPQSAKKQAKSQAFFAKQKAKQSQSQSSNYNPPSQKTQSSSSFLGGLSGVNSTIINWRGKNVRKKK